MTTRRTKATLALAHAIADQIAAVTATRARPPQLVPLVRTAHVLECLRDGGRGLGLLLKKLEPDV